MPRLQTLLLILLLPLATQAADKTTTHTITLPTGPLALIATVETLKLANPQGATTAEIVTTAFLHEAPNRPITFVFNGGPGAASAWLNLGAIGPWRADIATPIIPSQDPTPVDNAETWLSFTDLVFIDPPGTGYSRALGDDNARRALQTVDGDIQTLAATIRRWLETHGRIGAPIFIAGESYGGFRAPRLARALLDQQGIGVRGLILISPVLDFNGRDAAYDPIRWVARLPSLAAAARNAKTRADVADAETYAATEYLVDLLRGPNDPNATARITKNVAALTGLDPAIVNRRNGRIDTELFLRDREPGRVASPYDATLSAADPFPAAPNDNSPDTLLNGLRAPITSAALMLYRRLEWQPDGAPARQYILLNNATAREWDYGRSNDRPESMTALRQYLALDPTAQVLVIHGLTDLVTPYFATKLLLDQIPQTTPPNRLTLQVYQGGHMPYTNQPSRAALQTDAATLIRTARAAHAPNATAPGTPPPPAPTPPSPERPTSPPNR